jgi:hypothetical protein
VTLVPAGKRRGHSQWVVYTKQSRPFLKFGLGLKKGVDPVTDSIRGRVGWNFALFFLHVAYFVVFHGQKQD